MSTLFKVTGRSVGGCLGAGSTLGTHVAVPGAGAANSSSPSQGSQLMAPKALCSALGQGHMASSPARGCSDQDSGCSLKSLIYFRPKPSWRRETADVFQGLEKALLLTSRLVMCHKAVSKHTCCLCTMEQPSPHSGLPVRPGAGRGGSDVLLGVVSEG